MKIATYNVWNSDTGMPERERQIVDELNALDADVVALQEVRNRSFNERLLRGTDYKHHCFAPHEGRVVAEEPWRQDWYVSRSLSQLVLEFREENVCFGGWNQRKLEISQGLAHVK